jgi:hypothetical protein
MDPLAQMIRFQSNVGIVLLGRTLSCFVIDFVMLISTMFCVRFILSIQHYLIPFFEWDAGGTIRVHGVVMNITRMRCPARTRTRGVWRRRQAWRRAGPPPREGYLPSGRRAGRGSPAANAESGQPRRVGGTAAARRRGGVAEAVRGGMLAGSGPAVEVAERGRAVAWLWSSRMSGNAASSSRIRRRGARRRQGVSSDSGDCRTIARERMRGAGAATARAGNTMLPIVSPSAAAPERRKRRLHRQHAPIRRGACGRRRVRCAVGRPEASPSRGTSTLLQSALCHCPPQQPLRGPSGVFWNLGDSNERALE